MAVNINEELDKAQILADESLYDMYGVFISNSNLTNRIISREDLVYYVDREHYEVLRTYMMVNDMEHPIWDGYKFKGYTTIPANKINKEMMYRMVYSHTNKGAK